MANFAHKNSLLRVLLTMPRNSCWRILAYFQRNFNKPTNLHINSQRVELNSGVTEINHKICKMEKKRNLKVDRHIVALYRICYFNFFLPGRAEKFCGATMR